MPSPPEIIDTARQIGLPEIGGQPDAQHLRRADGNVAVAAEITVQLHAEQHRRQHPSHAAAAVRVGKDGVHQHGGAVGNDQLFKKAPEHQQQAVPHPVRVKGLGLPQLGQQRAAALDGACHQLGEKAHIQRVV